MLLILTSCSFTVPVARSARWLKSSCNWLVISFSAVKVLT